MKHKIIAVDQSTSATKVMLFSEQCEMLRRVNLSHCQYYSEAGRVEHDAEEIYQNVLKGIARLLQDETQNTACSLAITNQRETAVVWNRHTGKPICNAVVWQDVRGTDFCNRLKAGGYADMVKQKSGLLIDPYFSAGGVKWILDNVEGARAAADNGDLLMGTVDSWLIWKLTGGQRHVTDYTNASRTLLFNIHTLQWDEDLLKLFTVPASMMPEVLPCDAVFGETTVGGLLTEPVPIAGVSGDSHAALAGQMCFEAGLGKVTYGTGSSVMVNIGETAAPAPQGLVTSVGFAALGKVFYAFEGNIHCTGATVKWMKDNLLMIASHREAEEQAATVPDNGGVYLVPAFAGLGAPWWQPSAKAAIFGMTLGTERAHILRAALESIAYQVNDLVETMTTGAGIDLKEIRADGGPTKNRFLMQFQADCLRTPVSVSDIEEASALGAVVMNGMARKLWTDFRQVAALRKSRTAVPQDNAAQMMQWCAGWKQTVNNLINMYK